MCSTSNEEKSLFKEEVPWSKCTLPLGNVLNAPNGTITNGRVDIKILSQLSTENFPHKDCLDFFFELRINFPEGEVE